MADPGRNAPYEDIRILILEDNPADVELLQFELQSAGFVFTAKHVENRTSYIKAIREFRPDIILSDYDLPAFSGAEALKIRKEICPGTPFILVTGAIGEERAIETLTGGATDYVLKKNLSRLLPAINRALYESYEHRKRKEAEAERDALLRDPEHRVRERTAEEALRRAQARISELENANRELESFSYSVSHDLRAPLRAIDGFSSLLTKSLEGKLEKEDRRRLDIIRGNIKKMDHLIEDLLLLSQIGRAELIAKKIDMKDLAESVWNQHSSESPGRRITFRIRNLPEAFGDKSLIWQVFSNFLANAVKFTRKRKEAIIEAGCATTDAEHIYFIRDNGVGFSMKNAGRLFGVFQRLHPESDYEGTGVGLAIARSIVQRHGGRVWAEGRVGKGATFYFSLPKKMD